MCCCQWEDIRCYQGEAVLWCRSVRDRQEGRRRRSYLFVVTEGPYSGFAGRDASRGLATFSVDPVSDEYDDLSDLKPGEMEQIQEWELQFSEKYDLVGKLLKPGEESR